MDRTSDFRSFLPGIYPVAALLVLAPLADLLGLGWPLRPAESTWRFGALGLGFGSLTVQVLGVTLAMGTAAALGHRRILRVLAFGSLTVGTLLIAGIARFLLDYGQLRDAIPAAERTGFDSSSFRALISATLAVPVLLALGARALAGSREPASAGSRDAGSRAAPDWREPERSTPSVIPFPHRQQGRRR
jgi:hypothetical protein